MNPQQTPTPTPEHKSSPWRQPMVWLVIALPAAVVIAGIRMLLIAGDDGAIDTSTDQVQRMAQVQTTDLGPDAVASAGNFSAIVRFDRELELVEVLPVSGDFDRAAPLRLHLAHPARADQDITLVLAPGELGWRTDASIDGSHDWNVRLGPEDARWRLQGRLPRGQLATNLRPRLPAQ